MKEDLLQIISKYGINHQQRKLNEEVFELQEAITTHELKQSVEYEIPLTEIIGTKEHITEEIADVCVMLHQFVEYYGIQESDIYMIMEQKIDRQLERIKGESNE